MKLIKILACLFFCSQNLCFASFSFEDTDITNQMQDPYRLWMLRAMIGKDFLTSVRFMGACGPVRGENDPHLSLIYDPIKIKRNIDIKKKKEICEKYDQSCEQEAIFYLEKQFCEIQIKIKALNKKRKQAELISEPPLSSATPFTPLLTIDPTQDLITKEIDELKKISLSIEDDLDTLQHIFDDAPYTAISAWLQMLFPSPNFMLLIANQRNKSPLTSLFLEENLKTLDTLIFRIANFQKQTAPGVKSNFETEIYQLLTTDAFLKFEGKSNKQKEAFRIEAQHFASILSHALQEEMRIANPVHMNQQLYPQNIVITSFFSYILSHLDATNLQKLGAIMKPHTQRTPHKKWGKEEYALWKEQSSLICYDTPYGQAQLAFMFNAYNIYDHLIPTLPTYRGGVRATGGPSFYDCGENALLSFFIILLNHQGMINLEIFHNISTSLGPKAAYLPFQKFVSFWKNSVQSIHMTQNLAVHHDWANVVSDLNTPHDPLPIVYVRDNRWELEGGLTNTINLIAHLIPDDVLNQTTINNDEAAKYKDPEARLMAIKLDRLCQLFSTQDYVFSWIDKQIDETDQVSGTNCTITFMINKVEAFEWFFGCNHVAITSCEPKQKKTWKQEIFLPVDAMHFIHAVPEFFAALMKESETISHETPNTFRLINLYNALNLNTKNIKKLIKSFLNQRIDPIFYPLIHRILVKYYPIYDAGPCAHLIKLIDKHQESPFFKYFFEHTSDEEQRQINIIRFQKNLGPHQPPEFYANLHLPYCFGSSLDNSIGIAVKNGNINALSFMMNQNCDVKAYNKKIPLLHIAIDNNDANMTTFLLQAHADTTLKNILGFSPLFVALMKNTNIHILKTLIEYKADVHERREDGSTLLHFFPVIGKHHDEILRYLLKQKADIHAIDHHGQTPLHRFVADPNTGFFSLNAERISLFLRYGANPHHPDMGSRTPLQIIPFYRNHLEIINTFLHHEIRLNPHNLQTRKLLRIAQRDFFNPIDFLVATNADINMPGGKDGTTLLHLESARNGSLIEELIEKKADMQAKTMSGMSVLVYAMRYSSPQTIEILLKHQPEPLPEDRRHLPLTTLIKYVPHIHKDEDGNNLLHLAMMDQKICCLKTLKKLMDHQTDIYYEKNHMGLTPIDIAFQYQTEEDIFKYAVEANKKKLQQFILSHRSIDLKGRHKNWIQIAIQHGRCALLEELLNQGADINTIDRNEKSPLYLATKASIPANQLRMMKLLLTRDAHVLPPTDDESPLHIAVSSSLNAVKMLLDHKADVNAISHKNRITPLHNAATVAIVRELLKQRADINAAES